MTTKIVVATRSGLAQGPDGSKYRLARGRTLADARHPLAAAHPELFADYTIDLPYEGDEPSSAAGGDVSSVDQTIATRQLEEAEGTAEKYREQLAAIAEELHARGLVPADLDTGAEGWLARLIVDILNRSRVEDPSPATSDATAPEPPKVEPGPLPRPRKRATRPKAPGGQ